jgi:thioredoxin-like negative regulator of GroEL
MKITKQINYILIGFIAAVLFYALFITFKDIRKNMPPRESFQEPKLRICLFKAVWCHHCTKFIKSQTYNDLFVNGANLYKDVAFVTIDSDEKPDMVQKYNINSFPTIIAINQDGKLLSTFTGNRDNKDELIKFIKENI